MKVILRSLTLIVIIPLLALALEPADPGVLCDRFIGDAEISSCKSRIKKESVDWYAAAVCNLQKDNTAFWSCWSSVVNQKINPGVLNACAGDPGMSDQQRQSCIESTLKKRQPAFQDLEIKRSR